MLQEGMVPYQMSVKKVYSTDDKAADIITRYSGVDVKQEEI